MQPEQKQSLWKFCRKTAANLCSQTGERIRILDPGKPGTAPDISDAVLIIGERILRGDVVIQADGEDWYRLGLHERADHRNVVLHISRRNVRPIHHVRMGSISAVELGSMDVPKLPKDKQGTQALIVQATKVRHILYRCAEDTDRALRNRLIRHALPVGMQTVAEALLFFPWERVIDRPLYTEALLLGTAGYLSGTYSDSHMRRLRHLFRSIARETDIEPAKPHTLPDLLSARRIARLAALFSHTEDLFEYMNESEEPAKLLASAPLTSWWNQSPDSTCDQSWANKLTARGLAPLLYVFGQDYGVPELCGTAEELVQNAGDFPGAPDNSPVLFPWQRSEDRAPYPGALRLTEGFPTNLRLKSSDDRTYIYN